MKAGRSTMEWWQFWSQSSIEAVSLILSGDAYVWSTIGVSLRVSGAALIVSAPLAFLLAGALAFKRFPGRQALRLLVHAGMGFPAVIVGLLVLMLLTQRGPLGQLNLLWTPQAMILAQCVLILPLVTGVALTALAAVDPALPQAGATLGAGPFRQAWLIMREAKQGLLTAALSGFGRAVSEVGAVLVVGGNIVWSDHVSYTRTLTTAIVVETRTGNFETALALGLILFGIVLLVNALVLTLGTTHRDTPVSG